MRVKNCKNFAREHTKMRAWPGENARVSVKFGNDTVGLLRKTLTLSAETILYASAIYLG